MSKHDDLVRLRHMHRYGQEAINLTEGKRRADLETERLLNLALTRLIEIVGEAAARVSPDTKRAYPQIPWRQIAGMRNRLIHGYDFVDLDVLWETVITDLPVLLAELEPILPADP